MIFSAAHSADRHGSGASRGKAVDEDHGTRRVGGDLERSEFTRRTGGGCGGGGFLGQLFFLLGLFFRLLLGGRVFGRRIGFPGLLGLLLLFRLSGLLGLSGLFGLFLLVRGQLGFAEFLLLQKLGLAVRLRLGLGLLGFGFGL